LIVNLSTRFLSRNSLLHHHHHHHHHVACRVLGLMTCSGPIYCRECFGGSSLASWIKELLIQVFFVHIISCLDFPFFRLLKFPLTLVAWLVYAAFAWISSSNEKLTQEWPSFHNVHVVFWTPPPSLKWNTDAELTKQRSYRLRTCELYVLGGACELRTRSQQCSSF
jgi:hypothetical protein